MYFAIQRASRQLRHRGILEILLGWNTLYRQRQELGRLDPHLLDDIGLTQAAARAEANRPVWDSPGHWHF